MYVHRCGYEMSFSISILGVVELGHVRKGIRRASEEGIICRDILPSCKLTL